MLTVETCLLQLYQDLFFDLAHLAIGNSRKELMMNMLRVLIVIVVVVVEVVHFYFMSIVTWC